MKSTQNTILEIQARIAKAKIKMEQSKQITNIYQEIISSPSSEIVGGGMFWVGDFIKCFLGRDKEADLTLYLDEAERIKKAWQSEVNRMSNKENKTTNNLEIFIAKDIATQEAPSIVEECNNKVTKPLKIKKLLIKPIKNEDSEETTPEPKEVNISEQFIHVPENDNVEYFAKNDDKPLRIKQLVIRPIIENNEERIDIEASHPFNEVGAQDFKKELEIFRSESIKESYNDCEQNVAGDLGIEN